MSREATDKVLGLAALEQAEYAAQPHRSPCKSVQCVTCYPSMGDAYNAAIELPAASSPAAGRNSEGAVRKGSQAASSGPTPAAGFDAEPASTAPRPQVAAPASPTVPQGEAGPRSSDADAVGAPASEGPRWAPVDSDTGDLLDLLAIDDSLRADDWPFFLGVLKEAAAKNGGVIDQNHTRPRLHGEIRPARIGALYRRACREGLIRANNEDYTKTANSQSGNVGRPAKTYTWLGATS